MNNQPQVSIIMGSDSDLPTMQGAIAICQKFDIPHEVAIISAHRTPERMVEFAKNAGATLCGFVRPNRANIYSGVERIEF